MTAQDTLSALQAAIKADPADTVSRLALADLYESEGKESLALEQRALANLTDEDRAKALASFLDVSEDDYDQVEYDNRQEVFVYGSQEYLVLTDEEADQKAKEEILGTVWACDPDFLAGHIKGDFRNSLLRSIKAVQTHCSDDANELLRAALEDEDDFVSDVIGLDGRGVSLAGYDHEENEVEYNGATLYIYRVN